MNRDTIEDENNCVVMFKDDEANASAPNSNSNKLDDYYSPMK